VPKSIDPTGRVLKCEYLYGEVRFAGIGPSATVQSLHCCKPFGFMMTARAEHLIVLCRRCRVQSQVVLRRKSAS